MRKLLSVILAFVMVLALSVTAAADSEITVTGDGQVLVSADVAVVSLGVSARDRDVLQAQAKVNNAIASIRSALLENGIAEEDINTDYINIYAMYDYQQGTEELTAYNANSTLAIRVTDMAAVGQVIDLAFESGANTLNGITFSCSDTTEAEKEALTEAVKAAKLKAEVLAEASGLKLKEIEDIRENNTYSFESSTNNFKQAMDAVAAAGTVVQAAKISVTASVVITFNAVS